jgi:hypothetical protein
MTEQMVSEMVFEIKGTYIIEYAAEEGKMQYHAVQCSSVHHATTTVTHLQPLYRLTPHTSHHYACAP